MQFISEFYLLEKQTEENQNQNEKKRRENKLRKTENDLSLMTLLRTQTQNTLTNAHRPNSNQRIQLSNS